MELLKKLPDEIISINDLSIEYRHKYHLTLKQYTVYQLVFKMYQYDQSDILKQYLDLHSHHFDENLDFRNGVNDAFCEIVKAGVKKLALSHATDDPMDFIYDHHSAYLCAKKYGISYYVEESLIETLLFPNSGSHVIIFYKDQQNLLDYLALKETINQHPLATLEEKKQYAKEFGRLLSYDSKRVEEMIAKQIDEHI